MKKIIFTSLFILTSLVGRAQQINDSIVIFIDQQVELVIAVDDYDHLRDSNTVSTVLNKFQAYLSDISEELVEETADLIRYTPDSILSLEKDAQKNIFLITDSSLSNTGTRDRAIIQLKNMVISLTANDLSQIQAISLADCYEKMLLLLPEQSRYSHKLFYQYTQGELITIEEKNKIDHSTGGDIIELKLGVGASVVKNQLVGDFSFKLGFSFGRKGVHFSNPYASVSLMYDFSDGNKMHINTFLNLGHNWAIPKKLDKSALVGLEIGYLISRNGELFEENTFRFGINYALPSGFELSPQLYMGDGFKRFYPGVRMGFAF